MRRVGRMDFRDDGDQYRRRRAYWIARDQGAPVPRWWRAQPPLAKACYYLVALALMIPVGTMTWLIIGAFVFG